MVTEGELRNNSLDDSDKVKELQDKVADLKAEDNMNEIQKLSEQFLVARQIESSIYLGEYLGALKQKLVRIKADGRLGEMMESCNMNDKQLGDLELEIEVFTVARNAFAHMREKNLKNFTKEELESCTERLKVIESTFKNIGFLN